MAILAVASIANAQSLPPLKIATGTSGKGYSALFANIKAVCGSTVPLSEYITAGGLDNLMALSANHADLGIAQIDTLLTMRTGDENIGALQQVIALNNNFLHVFAATNGSRIAGAKKWGGITSEPDQVVYIRNFSQLRGRRVALVGSAQLLGRKLDKQLGYNMQISDFDTDAKAIAALKTGQIDAMMSVTGWPAAVFEKLKPEDGATMVNFDVPSSAPFIVKAITYRNIGVYNAQALASRNVLITRPFKGAKAKSVAALKKCIVDNLLDLQEGEYEPAWKEVKTIDQNFGVDLFK